MEKPKIVHVIYAGLGGHAHVLFPLLESFFGTEFENYVVFFGIEKTLPDYIERCQALGVEYTSIQKKPRRYLNAFSTFKKILHTKKPTTILVHSSELIIPAVRYARKHQQVSAVYIEHENNASKGLSLHLLSKYALKKAHAVVCLNANYKTELENRYTCKAPIYVIPNGINTGKFTPTIQHQTAPLLIGMASRIIPGKDHVTLLHAFQKIAAQYADVMLIIAGDGENLARVKALAAQLNLTHRVHFTGLLNEAKLLDFYASLSVYVLATHYETLSTGLLQAMACELPVITSNIKNNAVLVKHGETGLLYEDGNWVDLEQKIDFALKNGQEMREMGKVARQLVINQYSTHKMAENYMALIYQKNE